MYFAPQTNVLVRNKADHRWWGLMQTPYSTRDPRGYMSVGDNGAFNKKFEWEKYRKFLLKKKELEQPFYFTLCPDKVADAKATLEMYQIYANQIKEMGYNVAFAVQDGQEDFELPECDWLFIGGSTRFKLSATCADIILSHAAKIPIHVGRVSSVKRLVKFYHLGAQSADGTTLNFGDQDGKFAILDDMLKYLNEHKPQKYPQHPNLF